MQSWESLSERDADLDARGATHFLRHHDFSNWEDGFVAAPVNHRFDTDCICRLGQRNDRRRRSYCSAILHHLPRAVAAKNRDEELLAHISKNPNITLTALAEEVGVARSTANRFFHRSLDKTIYVSGWIVWKEGGTPSPLVSLKNLAQEESVPKPSPQTTQQRSSRYNTKKRLIESGLRRVLKKDPLLNALLGSKNG